jgi:hypothetical protein
MTAYRWLTCNSSSNWVSSRGRPTRAARQQRPLALELADQAARLIESEISMRIYAHTPRLWDLAQRKAKEIVAEVAALPTMPKQLWEVSNAAAEFARWREHKATYGTLTAAYTDFELCHAIGKSLSRPFGLRLQLVSARLHAGRDVVPPVAQGVGRQSLRSSAGRTQAQICRRPWLRAGPLGSWRCSGQHAGRSLIRWASQEFGLRGRPQHLIFGAGIVAGPP